MLRVPLQWSSEVTNTTADVVDTAAAHTTYGMPYPILCTEFNFRITTVVATTTSDAVFALNKLLITNDSTATEIATITVPNAAAVGNLYYGDLEANGVSETTRRLLAGQRLQFACKTAGVGTATGGGHYGLVYLGEHKTANRASHETAKTA